MRKSELAPILAFFSAIACVAMAGRGAAAQAPNVERHPAETESFEGACPKLSPNGRFVAIRRFVPREEVRVNFGNRNPIREDVWIRDLKSGAERLMSQDCRVLGWLRDDALALSSLRIVDPETGVSRALRFQYRDAVAGGDSIVLVGGNEKTVEFPLGHEVVSHGISQEKGMLWVSPRGDRVAFDVLCSRRGNVPLSRIGVGHVDTRKVTYVGESAYCHYNWGYQAQERSECKTDPWSRDGSRFAFVSGRGDGEANLHLASADGTEVLRLTDDASCKWSPVFDASGTRLAYFAARWGGEDGTLLDGHIRVLNLYTGEERRVAPAGVPGSGLVLAWSPDSSELIHDWHPGTTLPQLDGPPRVYRFAWPKAPPVAAGAVIKSIPKASQEDEVIAAILSESSTLVSWGVEHADERPTERVRAALCTALPAWLPSEYRCALEIVDLLAHCDAAEVAPVFRKALLVPPEKFAVPVGSHSHAVCRAITALIQWNAKASAGELRICLKRFPDSQPAVYAAGALVALGAENTWEQLAGYAQSPDKEIRARLTEVLALVREPQAVEILLELVDDRERLYWSSNGETQVGHQAVDALKKLTGQKIGRDVDAWRAWWDGQHHKLPAMSRP